MLGGRKGSTPLSYNLQPQAQYVFDPITRRAVRYVETIVPTISLAGNGEQSVAILPSDRYYAHVGAPRTTTQFAGWVGAPSNLVLHNFDSSENQLYARFSNSGLASLASGTQVQLFYPTGAFGNASSFTPKNTSVTKVLAYWKARFNANADYTVNGFGFSEGGSNDAFDTAANQFVQVTRNAGNWELGSSDGTTISQSSAAGADGSWHEFRVEWDSELRLYVDGSLVITKTTNLPDRPLGQVARANGTTNTFDIVDILVRWE